MFYPNRCSLSSGCRRSPGQPTIARAIETRVLGEPDLRRHELEAVDAERVREADELPGPAASAVRRIPPLQRGAARHLLPATQTLEGPNMAIDTGRKSASGRGLRCQVNQ